MVDDKVRELTKLRILQILNEPANLERGKPAEELKGITGRARTELREKLTTLTAVMPELMDAGLVERREGFSRLGAKAKPYFITEAGKTYLAEATEAALFPQIAERKNWTALSRNPSLHEMIANYIEILPEFASATSQRVNTISRELVDIISAHKGL